MGLRLVIHFLCKDSTPSVHRNFLSEQTTVWRAWQRRRYLNVMAERRPRRFKIGQGNDVVDESPGRCGSEIYVILEFVKRIDQAEIEIDWPKISAGIPGVSSRDVDGLNIEGKNDIL
jgi:hypothetical protein